MSSSSTHRRLNATPDGNTQVGPRSHGTTWCLVIGLRADPSTDSSRNLWMSGPSPAAHPAQTSEPHFPAPGGRRLPASAGKTVGRPSPVPSLTSPSCTITAEPRPVMLAGQCYSINVDTVCTVHAMITSRSGQHWDGVGSGKLTGCHFPAPPSCVVLLPCSKGGKRKEGKESSPTSCYLEAFFFFFFCPWLSFRSLFSKLKSEAERQSANQ